MRTVTKLVYPKFIAAAAICLGATLGTARAQVLVNREPVALEYEIHFREEPQPVGTCSISFEPIETPDGRRLQVKADIAYDLELRTPIQYREKAELFCAGDGLESFDVEIETNGAVRTVHGVREDNEFAVEIVGGGRTIERNVTAGVRRTNYGLFCGAFLEEPLDQDPIFRDYPLFFPAAGDHEGRQKIREGVMPFILVRGEAVRAIFTTLRKPDETSNRYWNAAEPPQMLLRKEETTGYGKLIYVLSTYNGVSYKADDPNE
jgi:hypothetical protein